MTLDAALLLRFRACVGPDIAADVEADEQVELAADLLERALLARAAAAEGEAA